MIDNRINTAERQNYFDAMSYFRDMAEANKLASDNQFASVAVSGPLGLEGLLTGIQHAENFVAIDDTNEGSVKMSDGAYFKINTYTVWILAKYDFNDMNDRQEKLNLCRQIYGQFLKRILRDKYAFSQKFNYLLGDYVETREVGAYFVEGLTGVEFHLNVSEPMNLRYDADEWNN